MVAVFIVIVFYVKVDIVVVAAILTAFLVIPTGYCYLNGGGSSRRFVLGALGFKKSMSS